MPKQNLQTIIFADHPIKYNKKVTVFINKTKEYRKKGLTVLLLIFLKGGDRRLMNNYLGKMLVYEREKLGILREELGFGICSEEMVRKLEDGDRSGDTFILKRLLERLGKSSNKIHFLCTEEELDLILRRDFIIEAISEENYELVEKELKEYEKITVKEPLHEQFIKEIKGLILYERDRDKYESNRFFNEALKLTLKDFSLDKISSYLFGEDEIIILLYLLMTMENRQEAETYAKFLLKAIDRNITDAELKAEVTAKISIVLVDCLILSQKYKEALEYSINTEKLLAENGFLLHLPELLERICFLSEKLKDSSHREWEKERDGLKYIFELVGECWESKLRLWKKYKQNSITVLSDMIKNEREMRGYKREEMASFLGISERTLIRIEKGQVKPKRGTLKQILYNINDEIGIYSTGLVVDKFSILELEREISSLMGEHKYQEAELLFRKLEVELDTRYKKNKQYIVCMQAIFDEKNGRLELEEIIKRLIEAFYLTRGEIGGIDQLGEFIPSKTEALIVNHMAICYEKIGNREKAIVLLERLLKGYRKDRVDLKYRYSPLGIIYYNLCAYYEEADLFEEAIDLANEAIQFAIKSNRIDYLGLLLEERTFAEYRFSGFYEDKEERFKMAYYLMNLAYLTEDKKKPLIKAFKKWYKKNIWED